MFKIGLILVFSVMVAGCASESFVPSMVGTPAPGSKFSKIQLGMSQNQVDSIIGVSKDCYGEATDITTSVYGTKKSFYVCPYKNEGRIYYDFATGVKVVKIVVDPAQGEFRAIQK